MRSTFTTNEAPYQQTVTLRLENTVNKAAAIDPQKDNAFVPGAMLSRLLHEKLRTSERHRESMLPPCGFGMLSGCYGRFGKTAREPRKHGTQQALAS